MTDELPAEGGAPESPQPTVDWQKRYTDTHAEYNRLNEQLSRFEKDPSALIEFIQEKHPELLAEDVEEGDTPESEYDEEPAAAPPDPRIDWLAAREAKRQYAEDFKEVVGDREIVGKQANDWIEARSRQIAAAANKPWDKASLKQAADDYFEWLDDVRGPTRKPTPTPPQPGKAGELKHDPRDRNARRARMAAAIEAAREQ
jgi:hypothetical protein